MGWTSLEKEREYYSKHKEYYQDYYRKNRDKIRAKAKERYKLCGEKDRRRAHRVLGYHKKTVLTYYGGDKCACVQCGESRLACLSIDHIKSEGNKHRENLGKRGVAFYRWLIERNYPEGYQTLCMNCQWVKRVLENECNRMDAEDQSV